ncbi:MAG: 30S ribosomal protein S6 [Planctomycetota bacterium]|jgi:small subunit ribosomal protein S6
MAVKNKLYEAMFLVDAADSQADWDGVESNIRTILARLDAEIVSLKKWDTRRLAYAIDKKSVGTYILCYFRADGKRMAEIERIVQLSERILRVLILSADHMAEEDLGKEIPAIVAEKQGEATGPPAAEETGLGPLSAVEGSEVEAGPAEVASLVEQPERDSDDLGLEEPRAKDGSESTDEQDTEKSKEKEE